MIKLHLFGFSLHPANYIPIPVEQSWSVMDCIICRKGNEHSISRAFIYPPLSGYPVMLYISGYHSWYSKQP